MAAIDDFIKTAQTLGANMYCDYLGRVVVHVVRDESMSLEAWVDGLYRVARTFGDTLELKVDSYGVASKKILGFETTLQWVKFTVEK